MTEKWDRNFFFCCANSFIKASTNHVLHDHHVKYSSITIFCSRVTAMTPFVCNNSTFFSSSLFFYWLIRYHCLPFITILLSMYFIFRFCFIFLFCCCFYCQRPIQCFLYFYFQMNFLVCQILALFFASFFRSYLHTSKVSTNIRHAFGLTLGLYFGYMCFGQQTIHIVGLPAVCYIIIRTQNPQIVQRYINMILQLWRNQTIFTWHRFLFIYLKHPFALFHSFTDWLWSYHWSTYRLYTCIVFTMIMDHIHWI